VNRRLARSVISTLVLLLSLTARAEEFRSCLQTLMQTQTSVTLPEALKEGDDLAHAGQELHLLGFSRDEAFLQRYSATVEPVFSSGLAQRELLSSIRIDEIQGFSAEIERNRRLAVESVVKSAEGQIALDGITPDLARTVQELLAEDTAPVRDSEGVLKNLHLLEPESRALILDRFMSQMESQLPFEVLPGRPATNLGPRVDTRLGARAKLAAARLGIEESEYGNFLLRWHLLSHEHRREFLDAVLVRAQEPGFFNQGRLRAGVWDRAKSNIRAFFESDRTVRLTPVTAEDFLLDRGRLVNEGERHPLQLGQHRLLTPEQLQSIAPARDFRVPGLIPFVRTQNSRLELAARLRETRLLELRAQAWATRVHQIESGWAGPAPWPVIRGELGDGKDLDRALEVIARHGLALQDAEFEKLAQLFDRMPAERHKRIEVELHAVRVERSRAQTLPASHLAMTQADAAARDARARIAPELHALQQELDQAIRGYLVVR
jgi:hypothetical protein